MAGSRKKLTDPDELRIAANIRKCREATEYSQADVAKMAGIPYANYVRYEIGETSVSATNLMAIADVFGRSTDDFRAETMPAPKPPEIQETFFLTVRPKAPFDTGLLADLRATIAAANRKQSDINRGSAVAHEKKRSAK